MRKLLALALTLTLVSGLYGLKLGLGVAYEGLADDGDGWLALKADMRVPLFSKVDVRANLLEVALPEGGKNIFLGTFTSSDLMYKISLDGSIKPYVAAGLWFKLGLEDAPGDYMHIGVKAGLGAEMAIGGLNAFLEGGLNQFTYDKDADPSTHNPMYVQLGITLPVGD